MSYKVSPTPDFKKLFKRLHKKHPSLKNDLQKLITKLEEKPDSGISLGCNSYKIRLAISAKGKGKPGRSKCDHLPGY